MRSSPPAAPGRASRGFTLLEVLAAVAILAIAYSTLGASGIQGLQHEGEARRRIEASLAADAVLGEIEGALEAGSAPELGEEQREQDGLRITVSVEPFVLAVPEAERDGGKRIGRARSRLGGDAAARPEPLPGPSLLGGDARGPGAASPLRRIAVRVAWDEGFGEQSVTRTTFALDAEAASESLGALAQAAAAAQAAAGGGAQANNPLGGRRRSGDAGGTPLEQGRR
jgi:prepilin-type N-terminal cleavage/methylation domain-containing protein